MLLLATGLGAHAQTNPPGLDPAVIRLVVRGVAAACANSIRLVDPAPASAAAFQPIDGALVATLPWTVLAENKPLRFHSVCAGRSPAQIYVLPGWPMESVKAGDRNWLRSQALLSREFSGAPPAEFDMDRAVPIDFEAKGDVLRLGVFGENLLRSDSRQSVVWQEVATPNPVDVHYERLPDRVRVSVTYRVDTPRDEAVPIHIRLPLAKPVASVWNVGYQAFRAQVRDIVGEKHFKDSAGPQSLYAFMSQTPMVVVRATDGSYISVLDTDLSNLVVETRRTPHEADQLLISTYLWPRERGRVYEWTFELMAGYENLYNAVLRAAQPFTKDNKEELYHGVLARETYRIYPSLEPFYEKGVRAMWYHRWFRRNGDYFNPAWPFDKPYETIFSDYQSYSLVKRTVDKLHAAGIKAFMYIQFAGVSEDMRDTFKDSLVLDPKGKPIRAGQDGEMENLWANPDPKLTYGSSVLKQIGGLLDAVGADGIALDRADRFDFAYESDYYDYGHFNGYSNVFPIDGKRRPVSSLAISGKAWFQELRKVLDARGKKLNVNLSAHLYPLRLTDVQMAEIGDDPNSLFLMKAFGNGKTTAYTLMHRENESVNNFVAPLAQVFPYHHERLQYGLSVNGMTAPVTFPADHPCGRLLFGISEDGKRPTLWYFDNGYTRMQYNPKEKMMLLRFQGSRFVPK